MIEILKNLFVGDQHDYQYQVSGQAGWAVVHACKEPYHRQALGYSGRGAPKNHPEYLMAYREPKRLMLNLVDADDYRYIGNELIEAAIEFIEKNLSEGLKVLVHCNQGESRGPSIGLIYLLKNKKIAVANFDSAIQQYRKMYPKYNPAKGMLDYLKVYWDKYAK